MTDWKRRLLAFLHDPPHKPFRIAGHEDARGPLLRHLDLSEEEIDAWHHHPDWWAAAADRFPFPRADVCFVDWKADSELEFRHPLCGSRLVPPNQPRPRAAVPEKWLEDAASESFSTDARIELADVAYDVTDDKRLRKVAQICEDFGVRVQYSIFECHLDQEQFDEFWLRLLDVIDDNEDRLVAYKLDARCAKKTETAGTMVCSEKAVCYLV